MSQGPSQVSSWDIAPKIVGPRKETQEVAKQAGGLSEANATVTDSTPVSTPMVAPTVRQSLRTSHPSAPLPCLPIPAAEPANGKTLVLAFEI